MAVRKRTNPTAGRPPTASPGQVAAGKGYAVFLPNYRGSTAYGTAFAKEHQGDYAGKEFDDLVDGKRALAAEGITDPLRTGITGGSYGGYASAWGATRYSEEYAASVMFVGISNNISKFGTTDIPNEMYLVHESQMAMGRMGAPARSAARSIMPDRPKPRC